MRVTVDSNLLVYAADASGGERHRLAVDLMGRAFRADALLILQTLVEFMNVVTRKLGRPPADAFAYVEAWRNALDVVAADAECFDAAVDAVARHGLSMWDAMIWAVAEASGCDVLLTEDLQDGRRLGRVQFVNPFDPANRRLVDTILPAL
jgi:predicted nucleic acid-binding protein